MTMSNSYRNFEEDEAGKDINDSQENGAKATNRVREDEATLGGPKFSPPLYKQRYNFCAKVLRKHGIKSVVDFGCAECQIMRYLKQVACLERIGLVDLDNVCLELNRFKTEPLITDYLDPRERPLTVDVYAGNLTVLDPRMVDYDAVTMVELIEHLPEAELAAFPVIVFGQIRPKLVVITTPNADFNQLFPDLTGFRHWDHKFEWTRQEFQDWCTEQAVQFNYDVEFTGTGAGPPGTEPLGYCSQAAIFTSKSSSSSSSSSSPGSSSLPCVEQFTYTLISSSTHPHRKEVFSREEKMRMEVNYCVNHLSKNPDFHDGLDYAVVPIEKLYKYLTVKKYFDSEDNLREFLVTNGYQVTPDLTSVFFHLEQKEFGEGLEWGCQNEEIPDLEGQFSDPEDDSSPWQPQEHEEMWE